MTQPPTPPRPASFAGRPPLASVPPAPPAPTAGGQHQNLVAEAIRAAIQEAFPSKQEIIDAIRQGTADAILNADD